MIKIVKVKDKAEGNLRAHEILKEIVDGQTLLALSGGTSVDYRSMLVEPDDVVPGTVCAVDERFGEPFFADSNELLMKSAGILDFCEKHKIEFHKILQGVDFLETEKVYDKMIADLFSRFSKKVGVMGVGSNLHTAGIWPESAAVKSPDYVSSIAVDDKFPKRITLTLKALGEFTNFVVLMFGDEKREAVLKILDEGENDMQKYPAIFYRKCPIKAYLITDQHI
jgi:6-phosphogluconolactonase/glucosamine-6-phosphate isomerase/deaminase